MIPIKDISNFPNHPFQVRDDDKMIETVASIKKHLKTLHKLREKNIVDEEYVYIRKNAFYNHIKDTKESQKFKNETFLQKL